MLTVLLLYISIASAFETWDGQMIDVLDEHEFFSELKYAESKISDNKKLRTYVDGDCKYKFVVTDVEVLKFKAIGECKNWNIVKPSEEIAESELEYDEESEQDSRAVLSSFGSALGSLGNSMKQQSYRAPTAESKKSERCVSKYVGYNRTVVTECN